MTAGRRRFRARARGYWGRQQQRGRGGAGGGWRSLSIPRDLEEADTNGRMTEGFACPAAAPFPGKSYGKRDSAGMASPGAGCLTIGLVNQADGSTRWELTTPLMNLSTAAASQRSASARIAVRRSKLEDFAVLRGNRVSVVCVVGVVLIQPVSPEEPVSRSRVQVPPLLGGIRKCGQDPRTQEKDVCKRSSQSRR
jgi:hypothetical protein